MSEVGSMSPATLRRERVVVARVDIPETVSAVAEAVVKVD